MSAAPHKQQTKKRVGLLLLNLGGPDSLDAVQPFLYNLFADNDIIQLPFPQWLQNVFAWRTSNKRKAEAQENYHGIGGRSPILPLTQEQEGLLLEKLNAKLGPDIEFHSAIAMRYWHPMTDEALAQLQAANVDEVIILPLYPHYSLATTGSSWNELQRALKRLNWQPKLRTICSFYDEPLYLQALAETIQSGLSQHEWTVPHNEVRILFSAHGLPRSYAKKNRDPYPRQVTESVTAVMQQYFPSNRWQLCFQSKVGPLEWLRPYTDELIDELIRLKEDNFLMVPVSFVSDHVETLYEMDQLYLPQAHEGGLKHAHRAPSLNNNATFISCLADLVERTLSVDNPCRIRWAEAKTQQQVKPTQPFSLCSSRQTPLGLSKSELSETQAAGLNA